MNFPSSGSRQKFRIHASGSGSATLRVTEVQPFYPTTTLSWYRKISHFRFSRLIQPQHRHVSGNSAIPFQVSFILNVCHVRRNSAFLAFMSNPTTTTVMYPGITHFSFHVKSNHNVVMLMYIQLFWLHVSSSKLFVMLTGIQPFPFTC